MTSCFVENLLEFLDVCPQSISSDARELLNRLNPSLLNRFLDLNIDIDSFTFEREERRRDSGYYDVETKKVEYTFPELIKSYFLLPWRDDQLDCLRKFLHFLLPNNENEERVLYIQAVFGSGKTTMLKAMVFFLLLNDHEYIDSENKTRSYIVGTKDILITAYNLSVKNELEKEMRKYLKKMSRVAIVTILNFLNHITNMRMGSSIFKRMIVLFMR